MINYYIKAKEMRILEFIDSRLVTYKVINITNVIKLETILDKYMFTRYNIEIN